MITTERPRYHILLRWNKIGNALVDVCEVGPRFQHPICTITVPIKHPLLLEIDLETEFLANPALIGLSDRDKISLRDQIAAVRKKILQDAGLLDQAKELCRALYLR